MLKFEYILRIIIEKVFKHFADLICSSLSDWKGGVIYRMIKVVERDNDVVMMVY